MRTISNKIACLLTSILLLISCSSCKNDKHYRVGEYLNDLAYSTGVNLNLNEEDSFNSLLDYGIVEEADINSINDDLRYSFLKKTISNFLNDENKTEYFLLNIDILNKKDNQLVDKQEAAEIIKQLVNEINNPKFDEKTIIEENDDVIHIENIDENKDLKIGDIFYSEETNEYKKVIAEINEEYVLEDAAFEEVYKSINIAGDFEINFDEAEIVDLKEEFDLSNEDFKTSVSYTNNIYELLASKRHTFNTEGYKVAYTINSGSIDFRISKNIEKGVTMYFDTTISSVKPTYKWDNSNENLNAYFKIDFDITNEIGVSTGKYNNYYLDFKDKDPKDFLASVRSAYSKSDVLEASIPICTIKTPIPNVPTATFSIDVLAKFYVSGRVEIVLDNRGTVGFEIKDNNFRLIHDVEKDYDLLIGASARAVVGLNFNICSSEYRLMDIEMDAGIKASVSTTLHLFDDDGNMESKCMEEEYYAIQEMSKENINVAVCGDLSLNWVLELNLNTSKSLLYKYGFSRRKTILDKKNQLFNNLTHIENYQFVKTCTRKNKQRIKKSTSTVSSNTEKIILSKYSIVIIKGRSSSIPIKSLPSGYSLDDLIYETNEPNVATINSSGTIDSQDLGSCKITIKTKDNKYVAYLNILVSTG